MKTAIAAALAAVALTNSSAFAQSYPGKTIRVIVPYAAGGNTDFTARVIATKLSEVFGQQIAVENRPGGATNIGSELVAKAPPDGYTLLMGGAATSAARISTCSRRNLCPRIRRCGTCPTCSARRTTHPHRPATMRASMRYFSIISDAGSATNRSSTKSRSSDSVRA